MPRKKEAAAKPAAATQPAAGAPAPTAKTAAGEAPASPAVADGGFTPAVVCSAAKAAELLSQDAKGVLRAFPLSARRADSEHLVHIACAVWMTPGGVFDAADLWFRKQARDAYTRAKASEDALARVKTHMKAGRPDESPRKRALPIRSDAWLVLAKRRWGSGRKDQEAGYGLLTAEGRKAFDAGAAAIAAAEEAAAKALAAAAPPPKAEPPAAPARPEPSE